MCTLDNIRILCKEPSLCMNIGSHSQIVSYNVKLKIDRMCMYYTK